MPIKFHPRVGEVLNCDYRGLIYPEMDKPRPVVVVSPDDFKRDYLCTVVPLSTTPPPHIEKYHYVFERDPCLSPGTAKVWAKCDMIMTVSFQRLSGQWNEKVDGKRVYIKSYLTDEEMSCIRKCILYAVGLGALTKHMQ
jgi:mRNA interferase MazF